ncbi:MAG: arylesterase [Gammaproteobacteria bacterium]|jgi:lysophospholipase L1-like esterase|nr:arylesterase [Gammaproteobacteria bacterium]
MKRPAGLTGLLLLALWLGACSDNRPQLPLLSADAVILAFGDSLTFGTGAHREQSYPAELARLTGLTVINAGIPGEVTAQGVHRLPALLDRYKPQLLLLCHGGNDLLRKTGAAMTRDNIEKMITAAAQRDIPTLLIGVPQPALMFLEAAPIYNEIAEQHGLVYEGEILPQVEADNKLKSDRIHPNAEGYRRMAEAISQLLRQSGAL